MEFDIPKLKAETTAENTVLSSIDENGIMTITLNRPKRSNSLLVGMYYVIMDFLQSASNDPNVKVVILRGSGKNFSGGNDLSNFMPFAGDRELQIKGSQFFGRDLMQPFCQAFIDCKKPIIAVVQGAAIGVAFTLLLLCDHIYVTEDVYFQAPLVKLAQGPEMCSSYTFPKLFGYQKAFEIIAGAITLKAKDLSEYRLVSSVSKTLEQAVEQAEKKAIELSQLDQESLVQTKILMRYDRETLTQVNKNECDNLIKRWSSENLIPVIMNFFSSKQNAKL